MPFVFTLLFGLVAAWSWAGFTLAELGVYGRRSLAISAGALSVAVIVLSRRKKTVTASSTGHWPWMLLWIVISACLFLRPGEYLIDGGDGSVALNIGARLATRGTFNSPDPVLSHIKAEDWPHLFPKDRGWIDTLNFFPGGVQLEPDRNLVLPGFFHMLPVWIANASLGGATHAPYFVVPITAMLSVLAFWLLGRQLFSVAAANVATALLCANFSQIWFARVPSSEILAQMFLVTGLAFGAAWADRPNAADGFWAGVAFGLAAATRIDVLLLVSPVVALFLVFMLLTRGRQPGWTAMALSFAGLTAQAVVHAVTIAKPYTMRVIYFASRYVTDDGVWLAAGAVAAFLLITGIWTMAGRVRWMAGAPREQWIVAIVLIGAAVQTARAFPDGAWLKLVTPAAALAGLASAAYFVRTRRSAAILLTASLLFVSIIAYAGSPHDYTPMPTIFRRFVPIAVPLTLLFIGGAVGEAWRAQGRMRIVAAAIGATLAAVFVVRSAPIVMAAPMRGIHSQFDALDRLLPSSAVVLTDVTTPSHFGLSLRNTFHRDVLLAQPTADVSHVIRDLAAALDEAHVPVFVAVGRAHVPGQLDADQLGGLALSPAGSISIERTELAASTGAFPSALQTVVSPIDLYRARPAEPAHAPLTIDIGNADLPGLVSGFFALEQMGSTTARWTSGEAVLRLPQLDASGPLALVLRIAGPRPASIEPPHAELLLDAVSVAMTPPLTAGFQEIAVPLDVRALTAMRARPTHLLVRTPTFMPSQHGGGADMRQLGAALDWIRIERR